MNELNIVVTGGSSGVGAALAARLSAAGHRVFSLDIAEPAAAADRVTHIPCDLADAAAIDASIEALPDRLHAVACVAGIARAPAAATVVAVNFLGMRHLLTRLAPRCTDDVSIVNVSSIAGRDWRARYDRIRPLLETGSMQTGLAWCTANEEAFARDPYTFSKRCVTAFTLRAAQQFAGRPGRINCISPGSIDTPLTPAFEELMGKAQADWTTAQTGRAAQPDEIADAVELLLTGGGRWINGADIPVDDGYSAGLDAGWIDFRSSPVMQARARREGRTE